MFVPVANLALLFFCTKSIDHRTDIVKKRVITVRVTFLYTTIHIPSEKGKRLSKLLPAWQDNSVYVLRMGGIKVPCPRPEVDKSPDPWIWDGRQI